MLCLSSMLSFGLLLVSLFVLLLLGFAFSLVGVGCLFVVCYVSLVF